MQITLTPEQIARLDVLVASGAFTTIEEAARALIDGAIIEFTELINDDLGWAKPYIEEARADVAQGRVMTFEEHRARVAEQLALFTKS